MELTLISWATSPWALIKLVRLSGIMATVLLQVPHSTPIFYTTTLGSEDHIIPWLFELFGFLALALGSGSSSCSSSWFWLWLWLWFQLSTLASGAHSGSWLSLSTLASLSSFSCPLHAFVCRSTSKQLQQKYVVVNWALWIFTQPPSGSKDSLRIQPFLPVRFPLFFYKSPLSLLMCGFKPSASWLFISTVSSLVPYLCPFESLIWVVTVTASHLIRKWPPIPNG